MVVKASTKKWLMDRGLDQHTAHLWADGIRRDELLKLNFDEKRELIKTHLSELKISTNIVEKENSTEDVNVLNRCSSCGVRLSPNDLKLNKTKCQQCEDKKK